MCRRVKRTALVSGEGYREYGWLEYLCQLYLAPDKYVRVMDAHGGSPTHQIELMRNELYLRDYDEKYALFDTDYNTKKTAGAQERAGKFGIMTVLSEPSVDYQLVELLTTKRRIIQRAQKSSALAKEELAKLCILDGLNDEIDWPIYFSKDLLDTARIDNAWLDSIIKFFE